MWYGISSQGESSCITNDCHYCCVGCRNLSRGGCFSGEKIVGVDDRAFGRAWDQAFRAERLPHHQPGDQGDLCAERGGLRQPVRRAADLQRNRKRPRRNHLRHVPSARRLDPHRQHDDGRARLPHHRLRTVVLARPHSSRTARLRHQRVAFTSLRNTRRALPAASGRRNVRAPHRGADRRHAGAARHRGVARRIHDRHLQLGLRFRIALLSGLLL